MNNVPGEAQRKSCPFCAEEVRPDAIKCKHCGSDISAEVRVEPRPKAAEPAAPDPAAQPAAPSPRPAAATALNKTRIARSQPATAGWGIVGLAFIAWAAALYYQGGPVWALVMAVPAYYCLKIAWMNTGSAPCPRCGRKETSLPLAGEARIRKCIACGVYFECDQGQIWAVAPDRISAEPVFAAVLPEKFTLPQLCCLCGEAATRSEEVSMRLGTRSNLGMTRQMARLSVQAPHCARHTAGAKLDRDSQAELKASKPISEQGRVETLTVLKVRSHAFYLRFLELNKPGRA